MSRSIASFVLAIAFGMLAGSAAAQAPAPDALLAEAQEFSKHGQYEQAIAAAEKAKAAAEKSFGPEHPLVAQALKTLAEVYELKGEPAKALPLYRRALAIAEKSQKPDGREVAELKARIAGLEKNAAGKSKHAGKRTGGNGAPPDEPKGQSRSFKMVDAAPAPQSAPGAQPTVASRGFSAVGEEGGTIPVFPWPPPKPSAEYVFSPEVFARFTTVGSVTATILRALENSGYVERSFYQTGDGGVALVTRLEKIGEDGSPAAEGERWPADVDSNQSGGFINFVRGLFFAPPGHYRTIVFVLQEKSFRASGGPATGKDADDWLKGGANALPPAYAKRPFGKDSLCTALIYEFASDGKTASVVGSSLTGKQHLQKAGVLAALVKPY